jgi:hypothetical protein
MTVTGDIVDLTVTVVIVDCNKLTVTADTVN